MKNENEIMNSRTGGEKAKHNKGQTTVPLPLFFATNEYISNI